MIKEDLKVIKNLNTIPALVLDTSRQDGVESDKHLGAEMHEDANKSPKFVADG